MDQQIIDKANYCLNCINKPCSTKGCPMHTQIPEFITMSGSLVPRAVQNIVHVCACNGMPPDIGSGGSHGLFCYGVIVDIQCPGACVIHLDILEANVVLHTVGLVEIVSFFIGFDGVAVGSMRRSRST